MDSRRIHILASAIASVCLAISPSGAEPAPTLEPMIAQPFRDNGVLQQKIHLPVWGTGRSPFGKLTFGANGKTNDPTLIWSGDQLMDLNCRQSLRIRSVQLEGKDSLLIESSGFSSHQKPGWKTSWLVLPQP